MSKMWIKIYVQTYSVLILVGMSLLVSTPNLPCPSGCSVCEIDKSSHQVIRATCSGVMPAALPTSVRELRVADVIFPGVLTKDSFENKTHLTLLEMTNSSGCSIIWDKAFKVCSKLNNLLIENTDLLQIGEYSFWGLVGLEFLSLKHNKLMAIKKAFLHVQNLKHLLLDRNQLHQITKEMFEGLTKLYELGLHGNLIDHIEAASFKDLKSLYQLDLGENQIQVIESNQFKGLSNLRRLDIKDNEISKIQNGAFSGTSLDQLDLEGNKLTKFPSTSFKNLTHIPKKVSVKKNLIKDLDDFTFQGLTMQILDLSGNSISHIGSKAFEGCHALMVLLDNNNISALSAVVEPFWKKARTLTVGGNPWQCDCDLLWMVQFIVGSSPRKYKAHGWDPMPSCVGNSKYAGKAFDKVKADLEADCITTTTTTSTKVTTTEMDTTTTETSTEPTSMGITTVTESTTTSASTTTSTLTQTTPTTQVTTTTTTSTLPMTTTTILSTTETFTPGVKPSKSNGLFPGLWIGLAILGALLVAGLVFWFLFGKNKLREKKNKVKPEENPNNILQMVAPTMIQVQAPASTLMPKFSSGSKPKAIQNVSEDGENPSLHLHNNRTFQTTSLA